MTHNIRAILIRFYLCSHTKIRKHVAKERARLYFYPSGTNTNTNVDASFFNYDDSSSGLSGLWFRARPGTGEAEPTHRPRTTKLIRWHRSDNHRTEEVLTRGGNKFQTVGSVLGQKTLPLQRCLVSS
eukprot:929311-Amphidinium_carterae.1